MARKPTTNDLYRLVVGIREADGWNDYPSPVMTKTEAMAWFDDRIRNGLVQYGPDAGARLRVVSADEYRKAAVR